MKKPRPRHRRSSTKRKVTQTHARSVPASAKRRRLALASSVATVVLLVGGTLAYEALKYVQSPDPRLPVATRAKADEKNLKDDAAAQRGSVSPTLVVARGDSQASEPAKVQIAEESRDLGTMAVSEERSAEFSFRNVGGKPLEISQVRTSCMCTFAHVIIDGEESPAFNMEMHNAPAVQSWKGVVEPGLTATVRVIYRPSLMPVKGSVARNVKFNTNDPSRPVVELGVNATVQ